MVPRPLHSAAGAPLRPCSGQANCGAEEKAGRSGRDGGKRRRPKNTGWSLCYRGRSEDRPRRLAPGGLL